VGRKIPPCPYALDIQLFMVACEAIKHIKTIEVAINKCTKCSDKVIKIIAQST
jgi:hypothetical protein